MPPGRNQHTLNILAVHSHVVTKLDAIPVGILGFDSPIFVVGIVSTIENRLLVHEKEHVGFDDAFNVFPNPNLNPPPLSISLSLVPRCHPKVPPTLHRGSLELITGPATIAFVPLAFAIARSEDPIALLPRRAELARKRSRSSSGEDDKR